MRPRRVVNWWARWPLAFNCQFLTAKILGKDRQHVPGSLSRLGKAQLCLTFFHNRPRAAPAGVGSFSPPSRPDAASESRQNHCTANCRTDCFNGPQQLMQRLKSTAHRSATMCGLCIRMYVNQVSGHAASSSTRNRRRNCIGPKLLFQRLTSLLLQGFTAVDQSHQGASAIRLGRARVLAGHTASLPPPRSHFRLRRQ